MKFSEARFPFSIPFPAMSKDAAEWNTFWQTIIDSEQDLCRVRLMPEKCMLLKRVLSPLKSIETAYQKRVLVIGNGLSALPYLFSYAGFDVEALDISSTAVDFSIQNPPDEEYYLRFFGQAPSLYNYRQVGKVLRDDVLAYLRQKASLWKEDTGRLKIFTQSIFEMDIHNKYDCVLMFDVLDFMNDIDARIALNKIRTALTDTGILICDGPVFSSAFSRLDLTQLANLFAIFQESGFALEDKDLIIKTNKQSLTFWQRWSHKASFEAMSKNAPEIGSKKAKMP